jgi:hypothetical protein
MIRPNLPLGRWKIPLLTLCQALLFALGHMPFGMLVLEQGYDSAKNEKARQKTEAGFAADGPT